MALDERITHAHDAACAAGAAGYTDPYSGLFVMTADYLRGRGWCCGNGCRHCPYPKDSPPRRGIDADGVD